MKTEFTGGKAAAEVKYKKVQAAAWVECEKIRAEAVAEYEAVASAHKKVMAAAAEVIEHNK